MKNIVIVGTTSAIAIACAREWAAEGAQFFLVARNQERVEQVAADLGARGAASATVSARYRQARRSRRDARRLRRAHEFDRYRACRAGHAAESGRLPERCSRRGARVSHQRACANRAVHADRQSV
jgi:NAD(P)-dependent dehydrogenase (short-subunit alcohol dehydrogenase family)